MKMWIIYRKGNGLFDYEAVQPLKLTPLNGWINRGDKGHYVAIRLKYPGTRNEFNNVYLIILPGRYHSLI